MKFALGDKKTVLLTGASDYVASQLLEEFRDRYHLRLFDIVATDRGGNEVPGVQIADLTDTDYSKYARLFEGADAVVHLGFKSAGGVVGEGLDPIDRFATEHENVLMANNVYRTAFDTGVRRVVMASSNHAADWYEHAMVHKKQREMVYPDDVSISDNFYGWAKRSYELLGFPYACGVFGRNLEVVQIRIGAPREVPGRNYEGGGFDEQHGQGSGMSIFKRELAAHLSARDLRQLFRKAIETPDITRPDGVPWQVVYGISGNTRAFWSLETARSVLGYEPEDDSEVTYSDDIIRLLTGPDAEIGGGKVGG